MRDVTGGWTKTVRTGSLMFCVLLTACAGGGGGGNGGSTCVSSTAAVAIDPGAATVVAGTTQPFVATVTGAADTSVTWSVQEAGGGTVSNTGVYEATAPPGTYHVVAKSQADSCATATAEVTVVAAPVITVSISPVSPVIVRPGGSQAFFATVTGTADTRVEWTVQGTAGGGILADGVYTAPLSATDSDADQVIATSVVDPTKSARVLIAISTAQPITISPTSTTVGIGGRVDFILSAQTQSGGWSVDGIPFGSAEVGTINNLGVYTAPYQLPTSTTAVTTATIRNSYTTDPANSASVTWVSRFLNPETLQVDACVPQCATDIPNGLVAADFNDDGLSDLATANSGTGTVSLLISADESHFAAPYRLQVGNPNSGDPQAIAAIDLNLDGTPQDPRIDLVIADADPSGLAVRTRLGVGDGTFGDERATGLPLTSNPLSIAVGSFDSDPDLDVAVANYQASTVDILQGMGDGRFTVVDTITTGVSFPLSIAAADFNRDGWDDLAVANSSGDTVTIFRSNADGTFTLVQTLVFLSGPSAVAVGSFNGDNWPDLVVTTAFNDGLTVILNQTPNNLANPEFGSPQALIVTGDSPVAVVTGDFNNDAVSDVVVANQGDQSVTLYLSDPSSDALVLSESHSVGQLPQALAVGDFNGDGWADVAVTNSNDDTVSVLRNRGAPTP